VDVSGRAIRKLEFSDQRQLEATRANELRQNKQAADIRLTSPQEKHTRRWNQRNRKCSQPTLIQAPWGGYKKSGVGRELGPWGLENYRETKQICEWVSEEAKGWGWFK